MRTRTIQTYGVAGYGKCFYAHVANISPPCPGKAGPPATWYQQAFDDSTWTAPFLFIPEGTVHFPVDLVNCDSVTATNALYGICPQRPEFSYYRIPIPIPKLPPGSSVLSILVSLNINEALEGLWWNSNPMTSISWLSGSGMPSGPLTVPFRPPSGLPLYSISVPTSYAFLGGLNVLAIETSLGSVDMDTGQTAIQYSVQVIIQEADPDWLIVAEPVIGITDQTLRLDSTGRQHSFVLQMGQRGSANYSLDVKPGDNYSPTFNSPMWLWDQNAAGFTNVFAGFVKDFKSEPQGQNGNQDRFIDCTCTSLEAVFDEVYAEPQQFVNQTCGAIVRSLYGSYAALSQVSLGILSLGATIPLFNTNYEKLSDLFTQLATTSAFIWGVDPATSTLYFCLPSTVAAPLQLTSGNALWDSVKWEFDGTDFRTRQAVRGSYDAFSQSGEFFIGAGQTQFTLMRAVNQVTHAYITLSTPNFAFGSFTGNPSPGDTVTVGPANGAWQATHIYGADGVIVVNGFVQKVTSAGTSGGTIPAFSTITGATTTDNTVIWTCQGALGLGTGLNTYTFCQANLSAISPYYGIWQALSPYGAFAETFVIGGAVMQCTTPGTSGTTQPVWNNTIGATTADGSVVWTSLGPWMDNTQFGMVLIGVTAADTCAHLFDAMNSNSLTRGITFSLPTWENSQGNAVNQAGAQFEFDNKAAGTGTVTSLSSTGANFSWLAGFSPHVGTNITEGGSSPQGSVGPNEGATIDIQVYAVGTSTAAPSLSFTQGSNIVNLATPLNVGTNLNVWYTRPDGNVVEVENSPLVAALSDRTYGTGEIQQISDQSSQGLVSNDAASLLQIAQQALFAYDTVPESIEVEIYQAGIVPGQVATVNLSGYLARLNGSYFVEEVRGEFVPQSRVRRYPYLDSPGGVPGGGHYRYYLRLINLAQIGSYLDFWTGLGGGSAGGSASGSGGGIGAPGQSSSTSGGGMSDVGAALTQGGTKILTDDYTTSASDYGLLLSFNIASAKTLTLPTLPFIPDFPQWCLHVENVGSSGGNLNIAPPMGFKVDGVLGGVVVPPAQGVYLTTDGFNFFTERGLLPVITTGAMIQIASVTVAALTTKVSFLSIPSTYNHLRFSCIAAASDGVWQAMTVYVLGVILVEFYTATSTYYYWKVTTAGTSGATIPAFSTHNSGTLTDGTVVWTNMGVDSNANVNVALVINNDVAPGNYNTAFFSATSSLFNGSANPVASIPASGPTVAFIPTPRGIANCAGQATIEIAFYKNTIFNKTVCSQAGEMINAPGSGLATLNQYFINHTSTGAISQIDFYISDGTYFAAGSSFILYGIL